MMAEAHNSVAPETRVSSYNKHIGSKLGDPARRLLETYSKIPSNQVEKHVYAIVCFPLPTSTAYSRNCTAR